MFRSKCPENFPELPTIDASLARDFGDRQSLRIVYKEIGDACLHSNSYSSGFEMCHFALDVGAINQQVRNEATKTLIQRCDIHLEGYDLAALALCIAARMLPLRYEWRFSWRRLQPQYRAGEW